MMYILMGEQGEIKGQKQTTLVARSTSLGDGECASLGGLGGCVRNLAMNGWPFSPDW
jgi:hypothetical protein